jgi:hypothetical protein
MDGPPTVKDPVTPSAVAVRECAHRMFLRGSSAVYQRVERSRTRGLMSSLPMAICIPPLT